MYSLCFAHPNVVFSDEEYKLWRLLCDFLQLLNNAFSSWSYYEAGISSNLHEPVFQIAIHIKVYFKDDINTSVERIFITLSKCYRELCIKYWLTDILTQHSPLGGSKKQYSFNVRLQILIWEVVCIFVFQRRYINLFIV